MVLNDLVSLVQALFPYLFDKYGFQVVSSREASKGQYRSFEIAIEGSMRMAFIYEEPSIAAVMLGTLEDSFEEIGEWIEARRLLDYIEQGPLRWKAPHQAGVDYVGSVFSALAKELEPTIPRILAMFNSTESLEEWKPGFDEYVRMEIKEQYGSLKSKARR